MTATAEPRTRPWRPGGTAGTVGELRARGAIVIPPARPRLEDGEIAGTD